MTTSSTVLSTATRSPEQLRLRLPDTESSGQADGAWWPRSRDLQLEAADLVDHYPSEGGRISRLLYSRPDWDGPPAGTEGIHKIRAARGWVKAGSFPSDDTHLMVLTMSSGRRLKLLVIPHDTPAAEGQKRLTAAGQGAAGDGGAVDVARWDNESPGD
ncbi:DUF5994 family protein [Nocardioides panacihumi]|uniref:DUF5994 family protein n=1 Tax=Nocardioides panacihumi TaxID=400774 RepID=A0ABN2QP48_9ACTN